MGVIDGMMQLETPRWQIWTVVLVHVAIGFIASLLSAKLRSSTQLSVILIVTISQAGLLGILAGLAPIRFMLRMACVGVGCVYLAFVTDRCLPNSVPGVGRAMYAALAITPVFAIWLLLSIVRKRWGHLAVVDSRFRKDTDPGLQFSIRQFMLLNAFLGLLLVLRPSSFEPTMSNSIILLAIIIVCAVSLILGSVWASLCPGRAWPRIAVVFLLAVLAGFLPPYYVRMSGADQLGFVFVSLVQALIMIASLLVVRLTGYRLIRNDNELNTGGSLSS